jgi:hypothetical protein
MEDILDKTYRERCESSITLQSVIFPTDSPKINKLLAGYVFENTMFESSSKAPMKNFQQLKPFIWVAEESRRSRVRGYFEYLFDSTIVVDWGAIARELSKTIISMQSLPIVLVDIIVLYASPLTAFVQENAPSQDPIRDEWNTQNNKWFLGDWSNTNYKYYTFPELYLHLDSCKDCMSVQLWNINEDKERRNKLFLFIDTQDKMRDLILYASVGERYYDEIGDLDSRKERVRVFKLVLSGMNFKTRHWFHENCPLDNF